MLASVTVSAHQALILMIAAKSPHLSYSHPSTANMLLEQAPGLPSPRSWDISLFEGISRAETSRISAGFHWLSRGMPVTAGWLGMPRVLKPLQLKTTFLCLLQPPWPFASAGGGRAEHCPKQGKHTPRQVLAAVLRAHLCNITSICLPSTAIMGCFRVG